MKHLKLYEKFGQLINNYNEGDYVRLKDNELDPFNVELDCKIIKIKIGYYEIIYLVESFRLPNQYSFNKQRLKDNELVEFDVYESDIERKLTPEEIKIYELKKEANKYNL